MKLLVDMNLSPRWVGLLAHHGLEAVHRSTVGAASAPDHEILAWAREHLHVLVTHDLDFSAILAATRERSPSVLQLRWLDLQSDAVVAAVATAARAHRDAIERGALLSIDERGARIRILPLPGDARTNR